MKKSLVYCLILLLIATGLSACDRGQESMVNKPDKVTRINGSATQKLVAGFVPATNELVDSKVDQEGLKQLLLRSHIFAAVTAIEVSIADDQTTGNKVAYFTITGIDPKGDPLAYQCDLRVTGNGIYMPDPAAYETFGTTHSCSGSDCSSCAFKKDKNGQIYGCTCLSGYTVCGHTITTTPKAIDDQFGWELVYQTYLK